VAGGEETNKHYTKSRIRSTIGRPHKFTLQHYSHKRSCCSIERGREKESGAIETGAHVNQYYVCGGTNLIMRAFFSASGFFFLLFRWLAICLDFWHRNCVAGAS